jgi:hypothetical protein
MPLDPGSCSLLPRGGAAPAADVVEVADGVKLLNADSISDLSVATDVTAAGGDVVDSVEDWANTPPASVLLSNILLDTAIMRSVLDSGIVVLEASTLVTLVIVSSVVLLAATIVEELLNKVEVTVST